MPIGPSRKPDSSTQVVPVISPFPFCENHPAYTGSASARPRGKITVTPVRTGPWPTTSLPSPRIRVVAPTSTPLTSVIASRGPGVPSNGTPSARARGPDWAKPVAQTMNSGRTRRKFMPLHQLHRFRIPMDNLALFVAQIAEQGRSRGTVAKHSIFYDGLASSHCGKEISEVIIAVAIAGRRYIFLVSQLRRSHGMGVRIFLAVLLNNARLHCIGEGCDHEAGLLFQGHTTYDDGVAGYLDRSFRAGEEQAFVFLASIHEVHAQT